MKFNKFKKYYVIFIYICYVDIIYADLQKKIEVSSTYQSFNISSNTVIFKTNVILKYKKNHLHADKIIITHHQNKKTISMLKALGNPTILYYTPKSGNVISARSFIMYYDIINNTIKLTGHAQIEQSGNSIQSDSIIYSINQKTLNAFSKENNKTTVTFLIKPF